MFGAKNCQNEKHWEALGFASAFRFANALHNIWLQRIYIKLTHICKSVLANSKTTPWYSPRRLVSIFLRGVYIIFQTINTLHTPGGLSSVVTKTYYQKHKQATVYLCPGKEKATLEMTYILEKALSAFKCTLIIWKKHPSTYNFQCENLRPLIQRHNIGFKWKFTKQNERLF